MKPAVNGVRVRESLWSLPPWDDTLVWYAKGVAGMRERLIKDPRSWRWQAAVHDYDRDWDPLAQDGDDLPSSADQQRFWSQCQHGSWFFLPWHRGYLAMFEQMVRAEIAAQDGPADDWALPYWNYSDAAQPDARLVREEFRADDLPDGTPNALSRGIVRGEDDEDAAHGKETGDFALDDSDVSLRCLHTEPFQSPTWGGATGFGGPKTGFMHGGGTIGDLERAPHGAVHVAVNGWLGAFNTAGLDPLFWCHHCNVDRLWEVWRGRGPQFQDPTAAAWTTKLPFELYDAAGDVISFTAGQVVDTTVPLLGYSYDDVSDPFGPSGPVESDEVTMPPAEPPPVTLVGASDAPVNLAGGATTTSVAIEAPESDALAAEPGHVYLNIENIRANTRATSYRVYVNAPDPEAPPEDNFAGVLPLFGVREASGADDAHGGSGLTYALDITDLVARLKARGEWTEGELKVSFLPKKPKAAAAALADDAAMLQVGRVSLYYG